MEKTVYIEASTNLGTKPAYLKFDIKIVGQTALAALLNTAPYFEEDPTDQAVAFEDGKETFEYKLPSQKDDQGDSIKVDIIQKPDEVTFDSATGTFSIKNSAAAGEYTV